MFEREFDCTPFFEMEKARKPDPPVPFDEYASRLWTKQQGVADQFPYQWPSPTDPPMSLLNLTRPRKQQTPD